MEIQEEKGDGHFSLSVSFETLAELQQMCFTDGTPGYTEAVCVIGGASWMFSLSNAESIETWCSVDLLSWAVILGRWLAG